MRLAGKSDFPNGSSQNHVGVFGCEPKSRAPTFMQKRVEKGSYTNESRIPESAAHLKAQSHTTAPSRNWGVPTLLPGLLPRSHRTRDLSVPSIGSGIHAAPLMSSQLSPGSQDHTFPGMGLEFTKLGSPSSPHTPISLNLKFPLF